MWETMWVGDNNTQDITQENAYNMNKCGFATPLKPFFASILSLKFPISTHREQVAVARVCVVNVVVQ